jgi:hypothetical protein
MNYNRASHCTIIFATDLKVGEMLCEPNFEIYMLERSIIYRYDSSIMMYLQCIVPKTDNFYIAIKNQTDLVYRLKDKYASML